MNRMKKPIILGVLLLPTFGLLLLFQNLVAVQPSTISYASLNSLTSAGQCTTRPSASGLPYYNAILSSRSYTGQGLRDVEVMHHAATRIGYGLSPIGRLVPNAANDCTTVFFAEELARQISIMGTNQDTTQLTRIRSALAPLSVFSRGDLNDALLRYRKDLLGGAYAGINPAPHDVLHWQAWNDISKLSIIRAALGSQAVLPDGSIIDHQINLEDVFSEFWFNHFNVNAKKSYYYFYGANSYPDMIRSHAGSTFQSLLYSVTRHPAMIHYLDNQVNRFDPSTNAASNQNLAREILELHSFGQGPRSVSNTTSVYSQQDIEAMANILAGWNNLWIDDSRLSGAVSEFYYNPTLAANFTVNFMGTPYAATGESRVGTVVAFLANHSRTKINICTKLASTLYAPSLLPGARDACIAAWGSGGNLKAIYAALLSRPAFWSKSNYRQLYRTPIELPIAIARQIGLNLIDTYNASTDLTYGFTASRLDIRSIDGATFVANYNDYKNNRKSYYLTQNLHINIKNLLGTERMSFVEPTGYDIDGADYLSPGYIDDVSRMALIIAGQLDVIAFLTTRRDSTTPAIEITLKSEITTYGVNRAIERYIFNILRQGHVVNYSTGQYILADSPYVLPPSHRNIISAVLANQSLWSAWVSSTGVWSSPRSEKTIIALSLANSEALRK